MKYRNLFFGQIVKSAFAGCLVIILFSAFTVKAQDDEITKIINDVSVDTQRGAILNYTYQMRFSYNRHKFGGRKFWRIYEAILPSRHSLKKFFGHPLILIEDSENRITDEQINISRLEIAKLLEKTENENDDKISENEKPAEDGGYWTVGFSNDTKRVKVNVWQLLKNSSFSNLRREEINGRSIIYLDFAPNPSAIYEKPLAYLLKLEGQIRIDEADKRVTAVEGYAVSEFAKLKDKPEAERQKIAVFLFLQTKVAEGFWFPQTVRLNFSKHPELFETAEIEYSFSNYKKGRVEIFYREDQTKTQTETSPAQQ